jgi:hypothetical protein
MKTPPPNVPLSFLYPVNPFGNTSLDFKDKTSEFSAAVTYITPDIINGTESWLKGEKHGENPTKDAIKSSEVFPKGFTGYRNDRGTLGGGVFILVRNESYIGYCSREF